MARHGVLYMLIYRKPAYIEHVCKLFHFVRFSIVINARNSSIEWIYSYLNSDYANYKESGSYCAFTNGNMHITVSDEMITYKPGLRDVVLCISKTRTTFFGALTPPTQLETELLYLTKLLDNRDSIVCYWEMVNAAKHHNLVQRINELAET